MSVSYFKLALTVFVSGAAVMIFELLGSRVVAPYLGSSIFTWTSLIGVILFALSVGYALGGRLADRKPEPKLLGTILALAGLGIGLATFLKDPVLGFWRGVSMWVQLKTFFAALTIFALPSLFMGMVSPFVARLAVREVASSGKTYGNISAISTAGSIVGTFLAGYWLISAFGTNACCYALALVLMALAAWWSHRKWVIAVLALGVVLMWGATNWQMQKLEQAGLRDIDTGYGRIWVMDLKNKEAANPNQKIKRVFQTDPYCVFTATYPNDPNILAVDYFYAFDAVRKARPEARRVLIAGGAGYAYPSFLLRNTSLLVDSVEIDPQMWPLAVEYFGAQENPRHNRYAMDIRSYLANERGPYDIVFYDVFAGTAIPFHTATRQAWECVKATMAPTGTLVINIIDRHDNPAFVAALMKTLQPIFAEVMAYELQTDSSSTHRNWTMVASDQTIAQKLPNPIVALRGGYVRSQPDLAKAIVLSDNYAPVENLLGSRF